jgi:hypothetical protein
MEYLVVCAVALGASTLTLFSGFGLGTLLLPAFLAFFPADEAVALTGVVHLLNNLFKLGLLGRKADWTAVLRFGIPAMIASLAGAWLLLETSDLAPIATYQLAGIQATITPVKSLMGALIIFFAILEARPEKREPSLDGKYLEVGGLLSGFFGGLSGHQGAFRSAFLLRAGLSRDAFLGTGVVLACLVDLMRLGVYTRHFTLAGLQANLGILLAAGAASLAGAMVGARLLQKTSMAATRTVVAALLTLVGLLLLRGLL